MSLSSSAYADTKPHYALLDGLRGVAALLVIWYHVNEGFAFASGAPVISFMNHGYLAVDFFFILSGFVIGYAYDDRWGKNLTMGSFTLRRLIRLHPMVVMGAVIGLICFLLQGGVQWDGTKISVPQAMAALLCAMLFIPAMPGGVYEVRGNGEAFPLNGPAWSLFFEYIGNIVYAVLIRRCSTRVVAVLAGLLAVALIVFTCGDFSGYGSLGVGWSMGDYGFFGGLLRMMCPFTIGILLSRVCRPGNVRGAFWICAVVLLALFLVPYIESNGALCLNGVFESFCIICVFPLLVCLRQDNRPILVGSMQVPRRYIVSAVHDPLPCHVSVLCLDDEGGTLDVCRHMARGSGCMCPQRGRGMGMPQVLRRARAAFPQSPFYRQSQEKRRRVGRQSSLSAKNRGMSARNISGDEKSCLAACRSLSFMSPMM